MMKTTAGAAFLLALLISPGSAGAGPDDKPVQVFILLGQSNMVGMGKIAGGEGTLEHAVKAKKKYPYLVDEAGAWAARKDVRFARYMSGKGPLANDWLGVKAGTIGPEFGIGHVVGDALEAPVLLLK